MTTKQTAGGVDRQTTTEQSAPTYAPIPAALVREVTEKVYAMLLLDLHLARERTHDAGRNQVYRGRV